MVDEPDLELPVDIHFKDRPVTLVYQLVGAITPFVKKMGEKGLAPSESPQRPGKEVVDLVRACC